MHKILEQYELCVNTVSDINEHLPTLKQYAEECEHITEMGVRSVVSTWAFLAAKPKKLVSIDINECPLDLVGSLTLMSNIDFSFRLGDTGNPAFIIEETDLLFIDTWHVYQQLKKEFKLHANKARKYIILHDTTTFGTHGESTGHDGLWPAVEEFLEANTNWTLKERFTNNNGLTILSRA